MEFRNDKGHVVQLKDVNNFDGHTMLIPDEMNSICVIDGRTESLLTTRGLINWSLRLRNYARSSISLSPD